ncbi:PucR family transcriptional regulator ligand-binding domain-containing protein [Enterococcus sp. AZ196]|uniref:PucR family transcriptional regulator ligand-binding domain-containing protein n=1 Tax=Enterococcus sp. AZ196 TaxID=2774659 RepID=UPI003D2C0B86
MNIQDMLKLPSMKGAKIVAGVEQRHRLVTTISVLEVSEPELYSQMPLKGEYSGNELVLTSFAQIAEDVEKQLEIISILHQHSQLGIVLYYVGLIIPQVSEKVIAKMNELGMVLILMPMKRMDLRYSEVISEVLSYINEEEAELDQQQDILLETIRQLPAPHQIETGLSILSDKLKCSLFIKSAENEVLLSKAWPRSLDATLRQSIAHKEMNPSKKNAPIELNRIFYFQTDISLAMPTLSHQYFLTLFRKKPLSENQLAGIKTIVEKTIKYFGEEQLLNTGQQFFSACQTGDFYTAALLAQRAGIDPEAPLTLYCLQRKDPAAPRESSPSNGISYKERDREWIVGNREEKKAHRVLPIYDPMEDTLFISRELSGVLAIAQQMKAMDEQIEEAKRVFPKKHCFYPEELYLLKDVTPETESVFLERYLDKESIDTLAVYFLDCNESIKATSDFLFLHNNTIKYRLKRAQERLGLSFSHTASRYLLIKNLIYFRKYTDK